MATSLNPDNDYKPDDLPAAAPPPAPPAAAPASDGGMLTEDQAAKHVMELFPGAKITSEYRDPDHNRDVGGVNGSMHTRGSGEAIDFVPPAGVTKEQAAAALKKKGLAVSEILDDEGHIHWAWGPKGTKGAKTAAAPQGQATVAGLPETREHADAMKRVGAAEKDIDSADKEYSASLDRYSKQADEIQAEMSRLATSLPKPPTLQKMPPAMKEVQSDPTKVLGQFLPLLGIFAGARAKSGSIGAMNAAAAAMNARRTNDHAAFEEAHQAWEDQMKEAHEKYTEERDAYLDVINNSKLAMDVKTAELNTLAVIYGNDKMKNAVAHGRLDEAYKQLQLSDTADHYLAQVINQSELTKLRAKHEETMQKAEEARAGYLAQQAPVARGKAMDKYRQQLTTSTVGKAYSAVQQYTPFMDAAADKIANRKWNEGNPIKSQEQAAFLDAFTKMITGQAIRGFTLKMSTDHGSLEDQLNAYKQKILGGGGPLSERQEKEMIMVARQYAAAMKQQYGQAQQNAEREFTDIYGAPPQARDLMPFNMDQGGEEAASDLPTDLPPPTGHAEGSGVQDSSGKIVAVIKNGQWSRPGG